ncbi:lysosome membrane protein 2 [Chanos chanos]|uniref:Lysosome membrane protein 2 n=1 Tax=Chanos chanos TaxID=29144 RepID=A0A6J2UYY2_CHACN|nr:lysosome membrane protein 2-like [Chanos chanos]
MTRRSCAMYATAIISAHLLIVGIALVVGQVFQTLIQNRLKAEIVLKEGSRVFETWKNPPPPVFMEFFFFNVTNADDVLAGKDKPSVVEVGPYTYREYRPKDNVTMVENATRVSAITPKTFHFLPEKSVGDPDLDFITTVNIPAVAVMNQVKGSFLKATMLSMYMNSISAGVFTTRSVNELLWGYKDPLLSYVKTMKPEVDEYFGLMLNKNGSNDGVFVYHTGEENYLDYGRVESWKGEKQLSWWASNQSNMINGTDGSAFHPFLTKEERLDVFTADLCRSIHMRFEKEVEVKGIQAYRFTPPREVFADPSENPANAGFCLPKEKCLKTGVLSISVCRKGAPVVASFPHFYLGDETYVDAIEGLSPNREHHQTFLDLNPTTGAPVRACKRAQINIFLERISGFPQTKKLTGIVFPVLFLNESVVVDDVTAAKLHKLLLMVTLVSHFPLLIVGLGVLMFLITLILIIQFCRAKTPGKKDTVYSPVSSKEKEEDPLENNTKNGTYIGLSPVEMPKS